MQFTKEQIEAALDSGKLFVKMTHGKKSQRCRRNGKTKVMPRKNTWRIPFKHGLKACGSIIPDEADDRFFEIKDE
jgi:hypothetical protein